MRRNVLRSSAAAAGVLGMSAFGVLAGPLAANAAEECAATTPAATLIAPGICEVRVTASTTTTFPSSIAKLSAVLVGAGGGGYDTGRLNGYAYGGDSGAVTYIDTVPIGTPVAMTVGVGGAAGLLGSTSQTAGTATSLGAVTAAGGAPGAFPGYAGAGAGGPASGTAGIVPGPGVTLDSVTAGSTLFPAGLDTTVYAAGGTGFNDSDPAPTSSSTTAGSGGAGYLASASSTPGENGLIILRFAPAVVPDVVPAPAPPVLAATGAETLTGLAAATALLTAGGLVLAARRRSDRAS
jgi:hypothetical protein